MMRWARLARTALLGALTVSVVLGGAGAADARTLGDPGATGGPASTIALASTIAPASTTVPASAPATPLRAVDWDAVLASEPNLTYTEEPLFPGSSLRIYVSLATGSDDVSGYPLFDDIGYGDIDGDGAEEAVIPLFSGGTAGTIGLLLYREAPDRPGLVLARSGYKLDMTIEGGRLVLYEPAYVGFEPNCCPSASTVATYRLVGNRLEQQSFDVEPNEAQEVTVYGFYAALSRGDFEAAYDFYSPTLKAASPFEQWRAGYRDTLELEVETQPGATPNQVAIDLTATDRAPGGGTVTRRFTGTWTVAWSPADRRWLLEEARIAERG